MTCWEEVRSVQRGPGGAGQWYRGIRPLGREEDGELTDPSRGMVCSHKGFSPRNRQCYSREMTSFNYGLFVIASPMRMVIIPFSDFISAGRDD